MHPALGLQRNPANSVYSGYNLDFTLFVITLATRYNFAVLFKFYEFFFKVSELYRSKLAVFKSTLLKRENDLFWI